jgi:hypothetical protein
MKGICTHGDSPRSKRVVELATDEGPASFAIAEDCKVTLNGDPGSLHSFAQGDEVEIIGDPATEIKLTRKRL